MDVGISALSQESGSKAPADSMMAIRHDMPVFGEIFKSLDKFIHGDKDRSGNARQSILVKPSNINEHGLVRGSGVPLFFDSFGRDIQVPFTNRPDLKMAWLAPDLFSFSY